MAGRKPTEAHRQPKGNLLDGMGQIGGCREAETSLKQDLLIPQEGKGTREMLQGTGGTWIQIASQGQTLGVGLYSQQRCIHNASKHERAWFDSPKLFHI